MILTLEEEIIDDAVPKDKKPINDYNPYYESKESQLELDFINYDQMFKPISEFEGSHKSGG